jgi:NADH-quinone oxidoreductase subunit C
VSERALSQIKARFGASIVESHSAFGDDTAVVAPEAWKAVAQFCRDELDCNMLTDLCGADYPDRTPRLEVVMHLYSIGRRHHIRLKTRIGDRDLEDKIEVASVTELWPAANWLERETFDMFGIHFAGHPDLRRILMYPEFEGHPLRKDYPAQRTQPLIAYRTEEDAGVPLDKQAPFRLDEGMSFGRHHFDSKERER